MMGLEGQKYNPIHFYLRTTGIGLPGSMRSYGVLDEAANLPADFAGWERLGRRAPPQRERAWRSPAGHQATLRGPLALERGGAPPPTPARASPCSGPSAPGRRPRAAAARAAARRTVRAPPSAW